MTKNDNPNQDICDMLNKLGEYERDVTGVIHKYYAYRKAIKALESYGKRVKNGAEAQKLSGIGPKIANKIDEFLQNGEEMIENEMKPKDGQEKRETESSGNETTRKKMKKSSQTASNSSETPIDDEINDNHKYDEYLISKHYEKLYKMTKVDYMNLEIDGIRTIGDLKKHKDLLNEAQSVCLEHFHDLCEKIPRDEIEKYEKAIHKSLTKLDQMNLDMEMCGQYRRQLNECYSIDVLIIDLNVKSSDTNSVDKLKKTLKTVGKALINDGIIKKKISIEEQKFAALAKLDKSGPYRQMNLHFVGKDQQVCALFHLTGNEIFCQKIREHSLNNGFILNEFGLCRIGSTCVAGLPIKLKNEQELFEYIEHPYTEPADRNL